MRSTPTGSDLNVFITFTSRMISIQFQRDAIYRGDQYQCDCLLKAVEVPRIQESQRDRVPISSHQLINRVANRL